jgi:hypothetical protein
MIPTSRKEAIKAKRTKYYTGKPCKHGHVAERYTIMGTCVECLKAHRDKDRAALRAAMAGSNAK